ncbi:hypothetical protein VUN82_22655 [Micrococcaceae bacterium Sec5.1]
MTLTRTLDVPTGNAVNGKVHLRTLSLSDAGPLAAAYSRNAEHLEPWEPRRNLGAQRGLTGGPQTIRLREDRPAPSCLHIAGEWQDHVLYQRILF